jgi:Flp pilus assembly protein TadB
LIRSAGQAGTAASSTASAANIASRNVVERGIESSSRMKMARRCRPSSERRQHTTDRYLDEWSFKHVAWEPRNFHIRVSGSALAIVAVLVLAVSIGMTTAIVTLVGAVLFHRLKDDARDRGIS